MMDNKFELKINLKNFLKLKIKNCSAFVSKKYTIIIIFILIKWSIYVIK
jgi:hypothetical protein